MQVFRKRVFHLFYSFSDYIMSSFIFREDILDQLKQIIKILVNDPSLLNRPELTFFKAFIEQLGGKVPKEEKKVSDSEAEVHESPLQSED